MPKFDPQQLGRLKGENLAFKLITDILSIVTASNYGDVAFDPSQQNYSSANKIVVTPEAFDNDETDEGTLKNIDLLSAFNDSTSDDVSSLVTDITEDNTLVDEQSSAIEDSLIASEEMQSAVMLYNDSFPTGQETIIENGKFFVFDREIRSLDQELPSAVGLPCANL